MKKILVGVDGSAESNAATEFAATLASETGAQILLAYSAPISATAGTPELMASFRAAERDLASKVLRDATARIAPKGIAVDSVVAEGDAAGQLAAIAKSPEIDLIVVGHRGRGAVQRMLLGSVADRLVQISSKPVVVYR